MKKKSFLIALLCLVLTINLLCSFSASADGFTATVETKDAQAGDTVEINITLTNNPGIISAIFSMTYDKDRLKLVGASDAELLPNGTFSPYYDVYPYNMVWVSPSFSNFTDNGVVATFKFEVLSTAAAGKAFINIEYDEDDIFNAALENCALSIVNGGINVSRSASSSPASSGRSGSGTSSGSTLVTAPTKTTHDVKDIIVLTIDSKDAVVFGQTVTNDVAPIIRHDRTMLPARFVAENLGAEVSWDEKEQKVTVTKGNTEVLIYIDSNEARVNGKKIILDSVAFIENDRTYTPLRFIAEQLGADVEWDNTLKQVTIIKK